MNQARLWKMLFWLSLMLGGGVFWFLILPYRYTALVLWGLGGSMAVYGGLRLLGKKHPGTAKWLRRTFTLGLCCGLTVCAVTEGFILSGGKGETEAECAYVLVLGAGVNGTQPSRALTQRLQAALSYLEVHPDAICVVSGGMGRGEEITEAQCMYTWLTDQGIDPERVWMEDKATSTMENIQFTLDLIEERTGGRPRALAIVSSEYHLYRAGLMAKDAGVTMLGVPARTQPIFSRIHYYFREIFGVWHYILLGK